VHYLIFSKTFIVLYLDAVKNCIIIKLEILVTLSGNMQLCLRLAQYTCEIALELGYYFRMLVDVRFELSGVHLVLFNISLLVQLCGYTILLIMIDHQCLILDENDICQ
jgi:hypothetical protein